MLVCCPASLQRVYELIYKSIFESMKLYKIFYEFDFIKIIDINQK
jgi:hypothetical protein